MKTMLNKEFSLQVLSCSEECLRMRKSLRSNDPQN